MFEDSTKKRPEDPSRVNINNIPEFNWWCTYFRCSHVQLLAAVEAMGTSVATLKNYLGKTIT